MYQDSVEMHQAFFWTCDRCGRDNFERAIELEPENLSLDLLESQFGADEATQIRNWIELGGEGCWVMAPTVVFCRGCLWSFNASSPDFEDE